MVRSEVQPWELIGSLVEANDSEGLSAALQGMSSIDVPRAISLLDRDVRVRLLRVLDADQIRSLLRMLPDFEAAEIVSGMKSQRAAEILKDLPSDLQVDLLGLMADDRAEAILRRLDKSQGDTLREMTQYPPDTAGGLMVTEYLAYPSRFTVQDVILDLRKNARRYANYHVQYIYILGLAGRLSGVVRVRDILLSKPDTKLKDLTQIRPTKVNHLTKLADLRDVFDRVPFVGLPVVDGDHVLLGVVRRFRVEQALASRNASDLRQSLGIVGGEETRTMPLMLRSGRRLSWLSVNIVLNILAASVIVFFEDTLSQVIALAVFLPIISDMSGCSGNQAVAVSLRELALGLVRPTEVIRVWLKEVAVGAINGVVLGALLGAVAWLWKGNAVLGLVVAVALALNTVVAVSIGGVIPLVLRRFKLDPALASGPILTTVTDMCGFFFSLGFATVMLRHLVS